MVKYLRVFRQSSQSSFYLFTVYHTSTGSPFVGDLENHTKVPVSVQAKEFLDVGKTGKETKHRNDEGHRIFLGRLPVLVFGFCQ